MSDSVRLEYEKAWQLVRRLNKKALEYEDSFDHDELLDIATSGRELFDSRFMYAALRALKARELEKWREERRGHYRLHMRNVYRKIGHDNAFKY